MKFITEEDLRNLFRKEPFTTYGIKAGERLTPGGRQFLLDRGISIADGKSVTKKPTIKVKKQPKEMGTSNNLKRKFFYTRMKSIEALFLITAEELLDRDIFLSQNIINLYRQFLNIKNCLDKDTAPIFCYKECTGIKLDNICDALDDCFEITEFHIQLKKGKDIIILHRLRCALREIEPFVLELFEGDDSEEEFLKGVIGKVNQSINTLSQMICSIVGGKICQIKS